MYTSYGIQLAESVAGLKVTAGADLELDPDEVGVFTVQVHDGARRQEKKCSWLQSLR